jgi:oligosaccharyl transferase (archaeosortase A-associated)
MIHDRQYYCIIPEPTNPPESAKTGLFPVLRKYSVPLLLLLFIAVAVAIRMLPAASLVIDGQVRLISTDPWFVMRQIDQVIHNFPGYAWFDPMTAYPDGKVIDWGPLFPVSAAAFCLLFGATTRPEAAYVASIFPVVLAALMVPVMYLTGRVLRDKWTGLIAAGLIAVVAGEYMYRGFFGYVDHHIMEVLLSTIFALIYLALLRYPGWKEMTTKDLRTWTTPLILSVLAGIAYLLGLLNMPTIVLFALIVGIFTLAQGIADYFRKRSTAYLLFMNTTIFGIVIIGFFIFGAKSTALTLAQYSMAHVYVYLILIVVTAILYALTRVFRAKRLLFIVFLIAAALFAIGIPLVILPEFGRLMIQSAGIFFANIGQPYYVAELQPWDLTRAVAVFNVGLILMAGGFLVLLYEIYKTRRGEAMFVLVWAAVVLFSTIQHLRYEYYLAVPVVLLSALAVTATWTWGGKDLHRLVRRDGGEAPPKQKGKPRKEETAEKAEKPSPVRAAVAIIALVLLVLFAVLSATTSVIIANHELQSSDIVSDDWVAATTWMNTHTPDPGVDYYRIYDKNGFQYPENSYGVLARWPAGHWITYIAQRIPNTNPFQDHITGPDNIYDFLFAGDENAALNVSSALGSRYVITDYGYLSSVILGNQSIPEGLTGQDYAPVMIQPLASGETNVFQFFAQPFFLTTATRLHNFDGSMVEPDTAFYVEYARENGVPYPIVTAMEKLPAAEARDKAAQAGLTGDRGAIAVSGFIDQPVDVVPALKHFRLVYESPTNARQPGLAPIQAVKIFEVVEGAHIQGDGIIELPLVTNEGRQFTYRQQSENGEFIVPYSTVDTGTGVRALGPYRIAGTGATFPVTEDDVLQGRQVH